MSELAEAFPAWTGEYQFGEDEAFLDRLPAF